MSSGSIINALIRCTRHDLEAEGLFEQVRPDLGLWVLELGYTQGGLQAEQIAEICQQLQAHAVWLRKLNQGSVDYTLHLAWDLPECDRVVLPPTLSRLAAECGFNLEIYVGGNEDGSALSAPSPVT